MASVLIVGSGGREHALGWKLSQSPEVEEMYFTGENAGLDELGVSVDLEHTDARGIARFVGERAIDLTVVGPDRSLEAGVVDEVLKTGHRVFGPRKEAARLETDKIWAHYRMDEWKIPHPNGIGFRDYFGAKEYIRKRGAEKLVLKANGLCDGKGVLVPGSNEEAYSWLRESMVLKKFGSAGEKVLIQDRLEGPEVSVFAICNGNGSYVVLPICQDYKRRYDGDNGPNTGGMGAVAPVETLNKKEMSDIKKNIIEPTLLGMDSINNPYLGVLYIGLMLTADGPQVIEYNARFGDPETQVLMPLISSDLFEILMASVTKEPTAIKVYPNMASASIALVSKDYPLMTIKEQFARGLHKTYSQNIEIFHGNSIDCMDDVKIKSGRGLHVVGMGETISQALKEAYAVIGKNAIHYEDMDFRTDIGKNI